MAIDSLRLGDSTRIQQVRHRGGIRQTPSRWLVAVGALLLIVSASAARAQQYQADEVDEDAGRLKLTAEQCVKNPARFASDRARFFEFFEKYYFPAMTRFSPKDLGELGPMRDYLFERIIWASKDENLQRELTQMAFTKLKPVVYNQGKNYHPATRYNAVLILGMLDETYPGAGRPPVPLKEAAADLTRIVDAAAEGKRVPPFLVVGALVGIERHAKSIDKLDRSTGEAMAAAVLKLATKEGALTEADSTVMEWIRIQADSALATIGSSGANGEVAAAFEKMIAGKTDPKMSLDGRSRVAAMLPQLKLDGAKVDSKALADSLLELTTAVADNEAKEAKAFTNMSIGGGGFGYSGGGSGKSDRMRLDPETQEWSFDKRILLSRLSDLKLGLDACKPVAPADSQPTLDEVLAAINATITTAESPNSTDIKVSGSVEQMQKKIRAAVKPGESAPDDSDANLF
jgi:hypothetical protein